MQRTRPRVTTIVPTYRRPELLARALKSVLLQTYPDYQVWVYDNASGDATGRVVLELAERDERFHYHRHAENIGSNRNFRFGLEHADTEFFSFLSDDDLLLPRFYELAVAALDAHPDAAMAATGVIHTNLAGSFAREPSLEPGLHRPPQGLVEMLRLNQPAWTGTLFRRDVVDRVGTLDEASVIDLDFELRIAAHEPFVVLAEAGAVLTTDNHFGKVLDWPVAWGLTVEKLAGDPSLPAEARQLARTSLEHRLETMVYQTGVVASRMGRVELARKAATLLATRFGDPRRAARVRRLAALGRLAPVIAPPYKRIRAAARSAVPGRHLSRSEQVREELRASAPEVLALLGGAAS
jgi:glycosyltransferase involved in cell wall biosynthesis